MCTIRTRLEVVVGSISRKERRSAQSSSSKWKLGSESSSQWKTSKRSSVSAYGRIVVINNSLVEVPTSSEMSLQSMCVCWSVPHSLNQNRSSMLIVCNLVGEKDAEKRNVIPLYILRHSRTTMTYRNHTDQWSRAQKVTACSTDESREGQPLMRMT